MNLKNFLLNKTSSSTRIAPYPGGQVNTSASTKKDPSASEEKAGPSATTGLSSQRKHATSSHGKRRGPSSIAPKDFADREHLSLLLDAIGFLAGKHGLTKGLEGIVPTQHLSLTDTERQAWQDAIVLMAVNQEFTVARRLLALCDTCTRAALLQTLPQDCLQAMLTNPQDREKRCFVQLIRTTAQRAVAKGQPEWALPLLDMLPPFDRAEVLLSLSDPQPAPQPLLAGKAPEDTLTQLEPYRQNPATTGASAGRASAFWQAYAACADAERKELRWRVPAAFPSLQAEGIGTGQLPSDVSRDIDDAFAVSPDTGLQACEAWLVQWPALTQSHPAKALALAWAVVCALETHAPSERWTDAQRDRRARMIERPLEQPLDAWTLAVLPGLPQADQEVVLAALVELAANVPAPRCVALLAQWVDVYARLPGTGPDGSAASAQCLRHCLIQGLTSLLSDLGPSGDEGLRRSMKALLTRLSGGLFESFNDALSGGRLEEAADRVAEMFQSGDLVEAGVGFEKLVGALKETLKQVNLAFGDGEGLSVVSTRAPQGEVAPFDVALLSQQHRVLERALMCLQSCGNADLEPFLPALRRWLKSNPLDESLLTGHDRYRIDEYRVRARVAAQSLAIWRPGETSLRQARSWLRALDILGREHTERESEHILDELSKPAFGQWLDAVMRTSEGRAGIERVLFELMLSPHVDEQTLRWLVGRHAHRLNLSAALSRAPQPNGQGGAPTTGVEGLLSLVKALVRFPRVLQMEVDTADPAGAEWQELMDLSRWLRTQDQNPWQPTSAQSLNASFQKYLIDHKRVKGLTRKAWSTSLVHGLPCPDWIHQAHLGVERMHRDTFNLWDDKVLNTFAQSLASANGLEAKAVWPALLHHLMLAITSGSTTIDAFAKCARGRLYSLSGTERGESFVLDPSWAVASVTAFRARLDRDIARGATEIDKQLLDRAVSLVAVWLGATRQYPDWTKALDAEDRRLVEVLVGEAETMDWRMPVMQGEQRDRLKAIVAQWFASLVKADH